MHHHNTMSRFAYLVTLALTLFLSTFQTIPSTAQTFTTISYEEFPTGAGADQHEWSVKWVFRWDGNFGENQGEPTLLMFHRAPNRAGLPDAWDLSARYEATFEDDPLLGWETQYAQLSLRGQHRRGPHDLDIDPGDQMFAPLLLFQDGEQRLPAMGSEGRQYKLFDRKVIHYHNPDDHDDIYQFFYTKQGADYIFTFTGTHIGDVAPEASSLFLLAGGILPFAAVAWRRRKKAA